jgi:hypothetical protein
VQWRGEVYSMALKECKECGQEISSSANKCPKCGKDQRNFFMRHKIISIMGLLIIFGFIGLLNGGGENSSTTVDKTISIDDYKSQSKNIAYDELARDPDKYKSTKVKFTGKIVQIQDNGSNIILRVNVTKGEYNIYKDTIWVNYSYSPNEKKLLENDIVNIWGESKGTKSYQSVLGGQITIPEVNARFIEFVGKSN